MVKATFGKQAASVSDTASGKGSSCPAGTTIFFAYQPQISKLHTCEATTKFKRKNQNNRTSQISTY
jgi:hypothetical protein